MNQILKFSLFAELMLYVLLPLSQAQSHEIDTESGKYQWNSNRVNHLPSDPALAFQASNRPFAPQYLVVLPNRWADGQTLRICFSGGSDQLRARILNVAGTWLNYANLKFDAGGASGKSCQKNDNSEIRIGFAEPGYWSYIGTDGAAQDLVSKNLSSMNFQGFDNSVPTDPRFTGIVLHEFGHALGFHHEHQSPAEGCDKEYNWDKLYAFYQANYGWDKSTVDQNVRQLISDHRAYDWSQPDPKSIMVYASDPQFLLKGAASPCYFADNYVLSTIDKEGAEKTYPKTSAAALLRQNAADLKFLMQHTDKGMVDILNKQLQVTEQELKSRN